LQDRTGSSPRPTCAGAGASVCRVSSEPPRAVNVRPIVKSIAVLAAFHDGYYSTVATVIPLFMVLLVFQTRVLLVRPHAGGRIRTAVELISMPLFVVLFVAAEWLALVALRNGHDPAHWKREVISLALIFQLAAILIMGLAIVLSPVIGQYTWYPNMQERIEGTDDPQPREREVG
jgi:hypothetical protein